MFNPRNPLLTDVALLLLRLVTGVVFIYHGGQKLFGWFGGGGMAPMIEAVRNNLELPMPVPMAWLAALSEFAGGILVLIGFFTRLAALPMIGVMGVAAFLVHGHAFGLKHNGMEFALTLGVVLVAILLSGPGRFSVDRLIWPTIQRRRARRQLEARTRAEIGADIARGKKP